MPISRMIRCGKCHVVMGVRYYVLAHRKPVGISCPRVPCSVCEQPVGRAGTTAFGEAVCSAECSVRHPGHRAVEKAREDVTDQIVAIRRARQLPPVYERRRAS